MPPRPRLARLSPFARYAWAVLAFNLFVIVWGAYVRASGSGAGCGRHWPMCNGEVVPRSPRLETLVEFGHRLTSGVALVLVLGMAVWSFRAYDKTSPVRRGALLSLAFILTEALIGAGLVLFELVAHDASLKRGFSVSLHLGNTFVLLACIACTAYWASGGEAPRKDGRRPVFVLLGPVLFGGFLLGTSGAIAALGDTLFPARTLAEGLSQDWSATAHVFVKLRALHPFVAMGVGLYVVVASTALRVVRPSQGVAFWSRVLVVLFVGQVGLGLLNVTMLAPVALQLAHLFLADLVWIALVILTLAGLASAPAPVRPEACPPPRPARRWRPGRRDPRGAWGDRAGEG